MIKLVLDMNLPPRARVLAVFITAASLSALISAPGALAEVTILSEKDHRAHAVMGVQLSLATGAILRGQGVPRFESFITSTLLTMAVATMKEMTIDKQYSPHDQWATFGGSLAGGLIAISLPL